MKSEITKHCVICQAPFRPDKRVVKRRTICDNRSCQHKKKHQSQQQWLEKNPDYFKGRYPQLKVQILANKKNQQDQSKSQPELSIQDELTPNNNKLLTLLENVKSIQDDITYQITESKSQLEHLLALVYKMI